LFQALDTHAAPECALTDIVGLQLSGQALSRIVIFGNAAIHCDGIRCQQRDALVLSGMRSSGVACRAELHAVSSVFTGREPALLQSFPANRGARQGHDQPDDAGPEVPSDER
jgi:hypothetical protein